MKVKDVIEELSKYDPETVLYDYGFDEIEEIKLVEWVDSNYPYTRPNEMKLVIF